MREAKIREDEGKRLRQGATGEVKQFDSTRDAKRSSLTVSEWERRALALHLFGLIQL